METIFDNNFLLLLRSEQTKRGKTLFSVYKPFPLGRVLLSGWGLPKAEEKNCSELTMHSNYQLIVTIALPSDDCYSELDEFCYIFPREALHFNHFERESLIH